MSSGVSEHAEGVVARRWNLRRRSTSPQRKVRGAVTFYTTGRTPVEAGARRLHDEPPRASGTRPGGRRAMGGNGMLPLGSRRPIAPGIHQPRRFPRCGGYWRKNPSAWRFLSSISGSAPVAAWTSRSITAQYLVLLGNVSDMAFYSMRRCFALVRIATRIAWEPLPRCLGTNI